jgi:hypothetical protein
VYLHAVPGHALGDIEVEESLAQRQATTKQVKDAGEEHPADMVDTIVEIDCQAARPLVFVDWATWGTKVGDQEQATYRHWNTTPCARQNWLC